MEWTVPFGQAIFHLGVHNLPGAMADGLMANLLEVTRFADESVVLESLAELSRMPGVLLVFNHPMWNFNGIPADLFAFELTRFLGRANNCVHAFELNGMRSHRENREVLRLAAAWEQLVVSGGDRHGCEPNAAINLTNAVDFSEFVDEIRNGKQSTVLLMPQYAEPLHWRFYQNFTHVVGEYPGHPEGRRRWDERTFYPNLLGEMVPLADLWHVGPPGYLKRIFAAAILAANLPVRRFLQERGSGEIDSLLSPDSRPSKGTVAGGKAPSRLLFGDVQLSRRK